MAFIVTYTELDGTVDNKVVTSKELGDLFGTTELAWDAILDALEEREDDWDFAVYNEAIKSVVYRDQSKVGILPILDIHGHPHVFGVVNQDLVTTP